MLTGPGDMPGPRQNPARMRDALALLTMVGALLWSLLFHLHLEPLQLAWLLGLQALGSCLAWRAVACPWEEVRKSGAAAVALASYLALDLVALLQTGAAEPYSHLVGLLLVGSAALVALRPGADPTVAVLAGMALAWGVQAAFESGGALAGLQMPRPPGLPGGPGLHLPPLVLAVAAGLGAVAVRFASAPPGLAVLLAGVLVAQAEVWPVAVAGGFGVLLLAALATPVGWPARALLALALLALPLWAYGGFLGYAARHAAAARPAAPHGSPTLFQTWLLSRLSEGESVPAVRLAALFPPEAVRSDPTPRLYRLAFPALDGRQARRAEPRWLVYSNNPETLTGPDFTDPVTVVGRETAPPGAGRLFASHFNTSLQARDLAVELYNPEPAPVRVRLGDRASLAQNRFPQVDGGTELWRRYRRDPSPLREVLLPPGGTHRLSIPEVLGNAMLMADLDTDGPVRVTTAWIRGEAPAPLPGEPLPRRGTQSRGLFLQPDLSVEARLAPDEGQARAWQLEGPWMRGLDGTTEPPTPEELKGDYGGVTDVEVRIEPGGRFRRVVVLLVSAGGFLGAVHGDEARLVHAHGGLVLFNRRVDAGATFQTRFTLPANSFAPAWMLVVPLPG